MPNIIKRLYRIARAGVPNPAGVLHGLLEGSRPSFRTETEILEDPLSVEIREKRTEYPAQVIEDLSVFGLTPPASLEEVRKARNREIKTYHSDRFIHDPERLETSKHIMQIYNAAYDRLKAYYETSS